MTHHSDLTITSATEANERVLADFGRAVLNLADELAAERGCAEKPLEIIEF